MKPPTGVDRSRTAPGPPAQLTLMGRFELRIEDRVVTLPFSAQRLVAFLAIHDAPLVRSYVAEVLWSETHRRRAYANLRSALWRIRQQEHELIKVTGGQLGLSSSMTVDLHERIAIARDLLDRSTAGAIGELRLQTVAALSVELLPDWFEEWLLLECDRWNQLRLHALEALAERLLEAGRLVEAVEAALAAVWAEPLRESPNRLLIRIYAAEGNWSEAVAQYHRYRQRLSRELHTVPTGQMEMLMRMLTPDSTPR